MAADKSEIERLREEYRRARRQATQKITRTRQRTGARLAGSEYDPRKPVGHQNKLTARQLRSGIAEMKAFTSRNNQYVAGAANEPLPKAKVDAFLKAQELYNRDRSRRREKIYTQKIAGTDMTYGDKKRGLVEAGIPNRTPLSFSRIDPANISSAKSLEKLTRTLKRSTGDAGFRRQVRSARTTLQRMAIGTSDGSLQDVFSNLSDEQVLKLYDDDDFRNNLLAYGDSGSTSATGEDVYENARNKVYSLVNSARPGALPELD